MTNLCALMQTSPNNFNSGVYAHGGKGTVNVRETCPIKSLELFKLFKHDATSQTLKYFMNELSSTTTAVVNILKGL